jgi:hypothetical protein
MKLGTHMLDGERRRPFNIEVCRTKVKLIFKNCDLDLCPTNLNIDRLPPLTIRHVCT